MLDTIDFKLLFEASPNPYMLLDRELRYVAANQAYLRVTASRLEDIVGRHVFEAFLLRDSFARVLERRAPDSLALIPYRVPLKTPEGMVIEERYWSATHTPIFDSRDEVAFILQHTVELKEKAAELRKAHAQPK